MKTERRHELQTNELAIWLAKWIEQIKPYTKVILGVAVLVCVVAFAVAYVNGRNTRGRADAWSEYFNAYATGDVAELEEVGKRFAGTEVAQWALLTAGDTSLTMGSAQMFRDRDAANEELENARDAYQAAVEQATDPMVKQRAHLGLGQALESLGEFTKAQEQYQTIVDNPQWSESAVSEVARQRLQAIQQPASRDWYAWFAQQKPAETPLDRPGLFDNLPNLPDTPDINLPEPGELHRPGSNPASSSIPGSGTLDFSTEVDDLTAPGSDDLDADDLGTDDLSTDDLGEADELSEPTGPTLFDPSGALEGAADDTADDTDGETP